MRPNTRLVRFDDLTADDLGAWRDLADRAVEPNVFFEPEVLLPAARHLAGPGAVRLAVVEHADGRWLACAPVRRVARWERLPLPCLTVWTHEFSGLEVPLVDAGHVGPAVTALLGMMRRPRHGAFAAFTQVPAEGAFRQALTEVLGGRDIEVARYERAALRRRPTFTYLDALRGKRRQELSRQRRRLEERHEGVATLDLTDHPGGLDMFLALEASGWKGRGGTALASAAGHAAFFREACEALRAAGRLELIALMADGRPIAMKCNGITRDRVFGFKQAFDESLAAYSPGRLLDIDTMRSFHDRPGVEVFDTIGSAGNESLNMMWPDRLTMTTVLVPARGPVGCLSGRLLRRALRLRAGEVRNAGAEHPLTPEPAAGR